MTSTTGLDFKRLFEGAPGLVVVLAPNPDFTILGASNAWLQATRTTREAIIGRGLFEILAGNRGESYSMCPGDLRVSLERLLAGSASDITAGREDDIRRLEKEGSVGERHWRPANSAVFSDADEILYLIHRLEDVTDLVVARRREHAEHARAEALKLRVDAMSAALEQAGRELESLSYSVSHDLRAPLRAIDGFSRILEEDYAHRLDAEGARVLSVIRDSSGKMGRLIEDVVAYSRLGSRPMSADTVDMFRTAREAFQEACIGIPGTPELLLRPLPQARGDAHLLRQVWLNLLANAVKFSAPRERAVIEVSAQESGAETVYCVRDNGVGFDMRYQEKLFGMFQRLHPEEEFPGSGAGLAIVQRLVARHGGRVWGESAPGAGATFFFSLPNEEARTSLQP